MPPAFKEEDASAETIRDVKILLKAYDADSNGKLDEAELDKIKADYAALHRGELNRDPSTTTLSETDAAVDAALEVIRKKYDKDGDGNLDSQELELLLHDVHTTDTALRYFGFMGACARSARYFRVLAKGYVTAKVIKGSFALAGFYIAGDCAWELYHAKQKRANGLEMTHLACKRLSFMVTSSIILPTLTIKFVNQTTTKLFEKYFVNTHTMRSVRITRVGPALCSLGVIPFMPLIWDRPCSFVFDNLFDLFKPKGNLLSAADERRVIEKARHKKELAAAANRQ